MLSATYISVLLVIFMNGFTDAANAVATAVGTKSLGLKQACVMSAVMNFAGVLITSLYRPTVAESLSNIVNLRQNTEECIIFVGASMFSVACWALAAWFFCIPTSESHALIASLTGCSVALNGNFNGINKHEWCRVIVGMILSGIIGFVCSFISEKYFEKKKLILPYKSLQIMSAAILSFLHGAQDGQKFLGVFRLMFFMSENFPFQLSQLNQILICSLIMGLGTLCAGKRIILSVGENITKLYGMQGIISDFSTCIGIAVSTYTGLPVSTTHVKTTSVIGVGMAADSMTINSKLVKEIILTWLLTFPGCAFLGYLSAKLFLSFSKVSFI